MTVISLVAMIAGAGVVVSLLWAKHEYNVMKKALDDYEKSAHPDVTSGEYSGPM